MNRKSNSALETKSATHCSSGLFKLKFHLVNHLVDDLDRFQSLFSLNAGPFESFGVHIKKYYGMTFRWLFTITHDTVMNERSALSSLQRPRSNIHEIVVGASVLGKRKCVEDDGGHLVRDEVCLSLGQICKVVGRAGAALPAESLLSTVLGDLFSRKWLATLVNCVRERM